MEFRNAVEAKDVDRMIAALDEDVVFRSPVLYRPYQGREEVATLVRAAARVIEDLNYERAIGTDSGADHALVFRAHIGGLEGEGCDFLHINEAGKVDEFFIMMRPLSAVVALAERMGSELEPAGTEAG
jgi:hypothetical protein